MSADADWLRETLAKSRPPRCAELTPFEVLEADRGAGLVRVRFSPQPAFENHFGDVQGGFGVAMLDVCLSLAAFAATGVWCPTVEIKCTFLTPLPVGVCVGEGRVLRAGRSLVFTEGLLFTETGATAMHATATASVPPGR